MSENDPYLTHLATLAVSLYPRYIEYCQTGGFEEGLGGSFTAAKMFLEHYLSASLQENLEELGKISGKSLGKNEMLYRFQDVLAIMDILAWAAEEPDFLKHCEITHPNCVGIGYICTELFCFAQNHLGDFPEGDNGKNLNGANWEAKELMVEEEYRLRELCRDMELVLTPDCLHAVMLAALLLTESRERRRGRIND